MDEDVTLGSIISPRRVVDAQLRARARRVIPGGMYGHLDAAQLPPAFPQFFVRGRGCRVWDVDGNEYLDFMCSWGPILLGHGHPEVEAAAAAEASRAACLNGPGGVMVELAELMVETVAHADWAMFCKNGTDATSLGVRIARAGSGRRKVLCARGAYHGIAPWSSKPGSPGVTPEEQANTLLFEYNDLDSLDAALAKADGDVAAVVVTPIKHELRRDLEAVDPEFAKAVRARCDRFGAYLLVDDIRCGFRLDVRGSWEDLGVRPDLTAYSKALANGHPLAALVGSEPLRAAAQSITATGSFWFAAPPMAAAIATIRTLIATNGIEHMRRAGRRFQLGLAEQAETHGFDVVVSGPPQLPFMSFRDDEGERLGFDWTAECVRRGVYLHPFHNWFIGTAHGDEDIDAALERTDDAFKALRDGLRKGERHAG